LKKKKCGKQEKEQISIDLKKKREMPLLMEFFKKTSEIKYNWMDNRKIIFNTTASS
jgi:hypothetical protein